MKVDVLLGLQWGDEGKGKIVDVLTPNYDIIARFQGGPNAGHTLEFNGIKHVLHTIPSGIFRKETKNVIGNGVVIDPIVLKKELDALADFNVDLEKSLFVSKKAHLILPTHCMLDAASEAAKGKKKIGSTLRGIGPTYMDKTGRNGLRVGDILMDDFLQKYETLRQKHIGMLERFDHDTADLTKREEAFFTGIETLRGLNIIDSEQFLNEALDRGERILAEGAQGSLLDIDFGSYPYVTSSSTICAGACTGLGIAPNKIGEVYGIFKAYCTRVGSGPFPTELFDDNGKILAEKGHEFGATTGRPRRCGWLDLPALKYACMVNGVTKLIMMKADVLSHVPEIQVATSYQIKDRSVDYLPYEVLDTELSANYEGLQVWSEDLTGLQDYNELPDALKEYVDYLEQKVGIPITIVSVGPDRTQTLHR